MNNSDISGGKRENTAEAGEKLESAETQQVLLRVVIGVLSAGVLALIVWLLIGQSGSDRQGRRAGGPPPASVTAARAETAVWSDRIESIGTLEAVQGIDVTSEITGKISRIAFASGSRVSAGTVLVELDSATERARLRSIEAELEQARTEAARANRLFKRGALSEQETEQAVTRADTLEAQAAEQRSLIAKKRIEAPFSGELGVRRVSIGQFISAGMPIVSLRKLSPIFVNFDLPGQHWSGARAGQSVEITVGAYPDKTFDGKVTAVEPGINPDTRNFRIQATLRNGERLLKPGMFAEVTLNLPGEREVVVIPATAISFSAYGDSVYFVREAEAYRRRQEQAEQNRKGESLGAAAKRQDRNGFLGFVAALFGGGAEQDQQERNAAVGGRRKQSQLPQLVAERGFVETGESRELKVEVVSGLKEGDRVVTSGQLKLRDGRPLVISEGDVLQGVDPRPTQR